MIGIFKQKSPGNIVVLLIYGLLLKLPLFLNPATVVRHDHEGLLYRWIIDGLQADRPMFAALLAYLLLYVQALMLNYLVNQYRMITRQNFLPAAAYLLITSLLPEWNHLSPPLVTNTLVIWMFIRLFSLYNSPGARTQVFNIGLLAGIASYMYVPSAVFIVCMLLGLMILKPFRLNELALLVLGVTTPYYFFAIYLFLTDNLNVTTLFPQVTFGVPDVKNSIWIAAATVLLTVPFLLGGYYVQTHLRKMLIQVRKNWSIVLFYLLIAFLVPFVNSSDSFTGWLFVAAPFAAFHSCFYFYAPSRWLPLAIFLLTIAFILYQQYGTQMWQ